MKQKFSILLTLLLTTVILFSCKNRSAGTTEIKNEKQGRDTFQMMGSFVNFPKQEIAKSVLYVISNDTMIFKIDAKDSSIARKQRIKDTTYFRPYSYYDSTVRRDSLIYVPTAYQSVSVHPIIDSQTAILMRWIKENQRLWPDTAKKK